jgi:hypothetical protein
MQNSNNKLATAPNWVAAEKQASWLLSQPRKMGLTVLLVL